MNLDMQKRKNNNTIYVIGTLRNGILYLGVFIALFSGQIRTFLGYTPLYVHGKVITN